MEENSLKWKIMDEATRLADIAYDIVICRKALLERLTKPLL
jgi:hypothetical protein